MEDLDGVGHVGNPVCGDTTELYTKIDDGMIAREHLESKYGLNV
jgi:NifU-like protein involved in Fe-S cluster formation